MLDATFDDPDLTTFTGLGDLGLEVLGQRLEPDRAVLACRVAHDAHDAGRRGRRGRPVVPALRLRRPPPRHHHPPPGPRALRCPTHHAAGPADPVRALGMRTDLAPGHHSSRQPRAKLTRGALTWALQALVVQHLTIARVAAALAVSSHTANDAVLAEGQRALIADPARFEGVAVISVDEHVWRHTRRGEKYVTVIIDPTPIRDGTGPARLLDMVEGRSKAAFSAWLAAPPAAWRQSVEVVAMDGFTGDKSAATEALPDAITVMDPFHVVRLAGDALDACRRRVQQNLHGHRGRTGDPLYAARRLLHTGVDLLTDRRHDRLDALYAVAEHAHVEVTWSVYQRMVASYRDPDRAAGRESMSKLIDCESRCRPS